MSEKLRGKRSNPSGAVRYHKQRTWRSRALQLITGTVTVLMISGFCAMVSVQEAEAAEGAPFKLPYPDGFSYRVSQSPGGGVSHNDSYNLHAVDFEMPSGAAVVASAAGVVYLAGWDGNGGNTVLIDHGNNRCSQYAHLSSTSVTKGQWISIGQRIGSSGSTGYSFGPHLHWNIIYCSSRTSREIPNTVERGTSYPVDSRPASRNTPYGLKGAIYERWRADGGETRYGVPTTGENTGLVNGGVFQSFQVGAIFWSPSSGAHGVRGGIEAAWRNLGAENAQLGYPLTEEYQIRDGGYYQGFQGGTMYWTPSLGGHYTRGAINDSWRNSGAENGPFGYPRTNEMHGLKNGGIYQSFEVGAAFWTPNTGAHFVKGAIEHLWRSYGAENSGIGYPKTGEYRGFSRQLWCQEVSNPTVTAKKKGPASLANKGKQGLLLLFLKALR